MRKGSLALRLLLALSLIALVACLAADANAALYSVKSVQARGGLRVRQEPEITSNVVYLLEDTETVIALLNIGEWTLVAKNIGDHAPLGWACSDYLK